MAKPEESRSVPSLQVRGTVDVEKFKAARVLGGEEVRFELRDISEHLTSAPTLTIWARITTLTSWVEDYSGGMLRNGD